MQTTKKVLFLNMINALADVLSEQLVDIEPATDVEVVSSVPTQDNKVRGWL